MSDVFANLLRKPAVFLSGAYNDEDGSASIASSGIGRLAHEITMRLRLLALPWQTWTTRVIAVLYGAMGALLLIILPISLFTVLPKYRTTDLTISIIATVVVAGLLIVCFGLGYGLWRQDRQAIWIVLIIHGMALLGSVSEVIQALTTGSPLAVAVNELHPADLLHLGIVGLLGGPRFLAWRRERREMQYWNPQQH